MQPDRIKWKWTMEFSIKYKMEVAREIDVVAKDMGLKKN